MRISDWSSDVCSSDLVIFCQHDDDGVNARKMLRFAPAAFSRPTSFDGVCRLAALSAKAVSFVPINQAPRPTVKRQFFRPEQRGHFPLLWPENSALGIVSADFR